MVVSDLKSSALEMSDRITSLQEDVSDKLSKEHFSNEDIVWLNEVKSELKDMDTSMFQLSVNIDTEKKAKATEELVKTLSMTSGNNVKTAEIDPIVELSKGLNNHRETQERISAQLFDQFKM